MKHLLVITYISLVVPIGLDAQVYSRDSTGKITAEIHGEDTIRYTYNKGGGLMLRAYSRTPNPLPVTLLGFKAEAKEQTSFLTWETATEINSSHFDVEHSTGSLEFEKIGEVKGAGDSKTLKEYQFTHSEPDLGKANYYRLKQVDFDGKSSYTQIRQVIFTQKDSLPIEVKVYPNPNNGEHRIKISIINNTSVVPWNFSLIDMSGKIHDCEIIKESQSLYSMKVSNLPSGTYILRSSNQQQVISTNVLITH